MIFNFDLDRSLSKLALSGERQLRFLRLLRKILFGLTAVLLALVIIGFLFHPFSPGLFSKIFGANLLVLSLFLATSLQALFYRQLLENPRPPAALKTLLVETPGQEYNLADFIDRETARAISTGLRWCQLKGIKFSSPVLLYWLISLPTASLALTRLGLVKEKILSNINNQLRRGPRQQLEGRDYFSQDLKDSFAKALEAAVQRGKTLLTAGDLLKTLAEQDLTFKKILIEYELRAEDIANMVNFLERVAAEQKRKQHFWEESNLALLSPVGRDLTAGYTITLDLYARNYVREATQEFFRRLVGQERPLKELEKALTGATLSNVLLVGKPGSGRKKIIKEFALRSFLGQSEKLLNYQRIIGVELTRLFARMTSLEQVEQELDTIFKEAWLAGNVILALEEFDNYVSREQKPGALNISGILVPHLQNPNFKIIATTSYEGLHSEIEKNPAILSFFTKIEVPELDAAQTLRVLEDWLPAFEAKHKKYILYQALRQVVAHALQYLPDVPGMPKRAIDLLDDVFVYASANLQRSFVLPEDVDRVVTERTEIPVGKLQVKEKETLLNLETLIHRRIVNQEEAVESVSEAMRRARAGVASRKGPMGSFLFLGPTGVGKTETSKALAEIYFGSEERMIRLDMSEFQQEKDIERIIGSATQDGILTNQVRDNPFSLVLLDEIEKANPNILNLFLQVLDEGFVTDGLGRKVRFNNTIIIGTSNAGSDFLWKAREISKDELLLELIGKNIFRPEFLNRFDGVIMFRPLSRQNLLDIADLMLGQVKANLQEQEITLAVSPKVKEVIVELSYKPAFGAREMRRIIQDKVENVLAVALLQGKIKRGDRARLDLKDEQGFELVLENSLALPAPTSR